ncbi:hypothetical protein MKX01_038015 [Papaver californicum]|nr:hypothetical protein MKX01_038015 [Papaver californicum]
MKNPAETYYQLVREEAPYGNLFLMFWNTEDKELQKKINTNKYGVAKLLTCYDHDGPSPTAIKFGDKILEFAPEKCTATLGMKRVGGRKGDKIVNQKVKEIDNNLLIEKPTTVDDEQLLCLIGFYFCCALFFGDINASSIHVKYLGLVETLKTVKKILFAKHTEKGTIPKVHKRETIFSRVGRWDVYEVSNFIYKIDMSQFTIEKKIHIPNMLPTSSFMEELSQIE